jgi:glyoxylate reductase
MTPANLETKGLIGSAQFKAFKSGLILVNTARPDIVEPNALLDALNSGAIGYASFDGFFEEPSALVTKLKQFIPEHLMVTGHIGSLTHDARDAMATKAVQSILNVLVSGSDANQVT